MAQRGAIKRVQTRLVDFVEIRHRVMMKFKNQYIYNDLIGNVCKKKLCYSIRRQNYRFYFSTVFVSTANNGRLIRFY